LKVKLLKTIRQSEEYNSVTGIGETLEGYPLGCLQVRLVALEGFGEKYKRDKSKDPEISVIMKMKGTHKDQVVYSGDPQVSKVGKQSNMSFVDALDFNNEHFIFAPIISHHAKVVFYIMDQSASKKRQGRCEFSLENLSDQKDVSKSLPVRIRMTDGGNASSFESQKGVSLYVRLCFQFSKILPVRNEIYKLESTARELNYQISQLNEPF